jgi:hypothetical protein
MVGLLLVAALHFSPAAPAPAAPAPRPVAFHASIRPLPAPLRAELRTRHYWHAGCPVARSGLALLSVTYHGFDGRPHAGQMVVNANAAPAIAGVFRRLYGLRFPIRDMSVADFYGPPRKGVPIDDITASFSCREAVPSPCVGGTGTGSWSMHAFGLAVDVNPRENPYVGCGQSRDPATRRYFDRTRHRRGMLTARAIGAFASAGWGWGGAWAGDTKDYMHFSSTGH